MDRLKVDISMDSSNDDFSTSDELSLASLKNRIHSKKKPSLSYEEKKRQESIGLEAKASKSSLKTEAVPQQSTSKAASISDGKRKKKRENKTESQQPTEETMETSDNEVDLDDYESDEDIDIITAGRERQDFSSDSDDDESSDDGQDTPLLRWSNKLKRIKPKEFKGPEPGAKTQLSDTTSALNHFFQIFPEKIFSLMAKSTNSYIPIYQQAKKRKTNNKTWADRNAREITTDDIRAYIGIRMIMAVDPKPCTDDYWSANPALGNQKIIQTMPRRRFQSIQRYFYVNDPTTDPTRMTDKEEASRLWRKKPALQSVPIDGSDKEEKRGIVLLTSRNSCRRSSD